MRIFGGDHSDRLAEEPRGSQVTAKHARKFAPVLFEDEQIHYLLSASAFEVEPTVPEPPVEETHRERAQVVVTDQRILVWTVGLVLADDRSIPYAGVETVEYAPESEQLTVETAPATYRFEVGADQEVDQVAEFVAERAGERTDLSELRPGERCQRLEALYEVGVLDEDERVERERAVFERESG